MSLLPSGSAVAIAARGSIAAPTKRLLTRSIATTWAADANAARTAASSPRAQRKQTLPGADWCSCGACRRQRGARVGDGGKRLVIHLDPLGGVGGLQQRVGDHRHDRLAAMAHGAARERKTRRLRHRRAVARAHRPQRPHRRHAVRGHVGAGEHRDHAGQCHRRRGVDPANARMRVRRAHQHAGERAGKLDVGDEAPAPEQETAILDAAQRRADALVVSRPGALARVRHRRATYSLVRCRILRCHLARFRRKGYRAGPQGAHFCTAPPAGRVWRKENHRARRPRNDSSAFEAGLPLRADLHPPWSRTCQSRHLPLPLLWAVEYCNCGSPQRNVPTSPPDE